MGAYPAAGYDFSPEPTRFRHLCRYSSPGQEKNLNIGCQNLYFFCQQNIFCIIMTPMRELDAGGGFMVASMPADYAEPKNMIFLTGPRAVAV